MTKFGDIGEFRTGGTPASSHPEYYGTEYPWITTVALGSTFIDSSDATTFLSDEGLKNSSTKVIDADSLMVGIRVGVGKCSINCEPMCTSQDIVSIVGIDKSKYYLPFLVAFINSKKDYFDAQKRGATIKGITTALIKDLDLPNLSYSQQREVASILEGLQQLIDQHKEMLVQIDLLVKSRFIEMFGDPISNTMAWPYMPLSKICKDILGGGTPSKSHPEYFSGNIPWVSPKDMKQAVIYDSIDHITEEAISRSTTNLIPAQSVLMVIRSGILKHTLPVAINSVPVTINQDMKAFIPGETITAAYLMYYFKAIEADVLTGVRSVTADNIDFKAFVKRNVIVPPKHLQEQFAAFIIQTDKSKYSELLSSTEGWCAA